MKIAGWLRLMPVLALLPIFSCFGGEQSDEAVRQGVINFLMPRCGGGNVEGDEPPDPELTEYFGHGVDTNRLARILVEVAQTNNAWYSEMAMRELVKYGSAEQLPFLYSCATNPAIGDLAVRAAVRIEGITSNSVAILRDYLSFTNTVTRSQAYDRAQTSRYFLERLQGGSVLPDVRNATFQVVQSFAADINTSNSIVDEALVAADGTYRHSKRRLAVLRAAYPRCFNEYQTDYVTNAINELVAYPEANLPD